MFIENEYVNWYEMSKSKISLKYTRQMNVFLYFNGERFQHIFFPCTLRLRDK
jgi:hypothetical protein